MSHRFKFRDQSKGIIHLILLVIIVLAYVFPDSLLKETDESVAQKIENQIIEDNKRIEVIATDLQETLLINGKSTYQSKAINYHNKYSNRFAFYLYENDTLSLWTDNHIPVPAYIWELEEGKIQKFGSYQVILHHRSFYQFELVYLQILMLDYPWQNSYLKDHFADYFQINVDVCISKQDGIPIKDVEGNQIFQIQTHDQLSSKAGGYEFFLFVLGFFILYNLLSFLFRHWNLKNQLLKSVFFIAVLFVWYYFHTYFKIPSKLFDSDLFSPGLYAFNWINNNLGNLFFTSLIIFLGIIYYVRNARNRSYPYFLIYPFTAFLLIYLYLIIYITRSLVLDSQITIDLYQLASLDLYSYLALWIIFLLQFSWILLTSRWMYHFIDLRSAEKNLWLALLFFGLIPLFFNGKFSFQLWFIQLMGSIGILLVFYLQQKSHQRKLMEVITYLIFFTLITALVLNDLNRQKERQFRETSAMNLEMENDPYLESHFLSNLNMIKQDTTLLNLVYNNKSESISDSILYHYIRKKYFDTYLGVYNINLIPCNENSLITVMPDDFEVSCYDYFAERIQSAKSVIRENVFYLVEGDFQYRNYIGRINLEPDSLPQSCIFIEFVSKVKQQESGLPAILEKSHVFRFPLLRKYSYAYFKDGDLIDWRGVYDYRQKLSDYHLVSYHDSFFEKDGFQHYIYSNQPGSVLMISLEKPGMLQKLASFAFVFLFYSLLTFLLYTFFSTSSLYESFSNFQGRLQYSMIVLLLFSFVLIGFSSLYYIIYLNRQKNADNLIDKAHSVLIELEHKLAGMENFSNADKIYVESLLAKFSEVFFTDITLYSRDGKLIAGSRPEVFKSELLAGNMNAQAFYQLSGLKNSFYIHDEQIGTQKYLSAYLPFRNQDNKSVAYLNLPYFAKQYELENEVSGFIVAFLNIYLFLLFITIMITILISRYLSRPLLIIKDKISNLNLQQENEKIEWDKNDEIGDLIKEYNRMVEELQESAEKLAISQRESAWREMAQQIAHEIKNPLTPMKLNVQYLERAWDDGVEDYEERMKKITQALKEQIDALAEIAGQFGTFAAIEKLNPEKLDIEPIILSVISVFKVNDKIKFESQISTNGYQVMIDKNQIIRVLNNVYKNAVQALNQNDNPVIRTICKLEGNYLQIDISDNGVGIPIQEISRIFEPRFTTKSGGMGLGLALVKKMLENANASIYVNSEEGKGSTFSISIPLIKSSDRENTSP